MAKKPYNWSYASVLRGYRPTDFNSPAAAAVPAGRCRCCGLNIPAPTATLPGTSERVAVMAERYAFGQCLYHPHDARIREGRSAFRGRLDAWGNPYRVQVVEETHAEPRAVG